MADDNARVVHVPEREVGWQLAMAFGQGAGGTVMATRGALALAFETYGRKLEGDPDWKNKSVVALEFARILGRMAAFHAASQGRCVIDIPDVESALLAVRMTEMEPLEGCPITDRVNLKR
jgi:hypothetical protein